MQNWFGHTAKQGSDGAKKSNAAAAAIHDEDIAPENGSYEAAILVGGEAAQNWQLQHRDAANGANLFTADIWSVTNQTGQYVWRFEMKKDERIRIVSVDGFGVGIESGARLSLERLK